MEVLHELLLHAGEVVSKDELLDSVWRGVTVVESSLATAISKLRRALGDSAGDIIVTVPRIGYQLAVPVHVESLDSGIQPRFAFQPGEHVPGRPQWRLVAMLGGAGDVWRASHDKTGEKRVFKFADTPDRLRSLKREATLARLLLASLGPNGPFVPLLEWNFTTSPFFLESRDGGQSLIDWAAGCGGLVTIALDRRLTVARAIARAVAIVHGAGVLHKDLKPANILIEERGEAFRIRLADFGSGLADQDALAAHGITLMQTGEDPWRSSGTPFYRAPELAAGALPTARSDIYALGLILYQLAVGDFSRALSPGWETDVADPLLREDIALAAAGDPERRLGSATELATRLEQLDSRRADAAERSAQAMRMARLAAAEDRRAARRPWVRGAWAAVLVGLVGTSAATVIAVHQRNAARHQQQIAEASFAFLSDDLLARGDPANATAADEPIGEAAERASAEIDRRFRAAPLIAGGLHAALARAFDQRTDLIPAVHEYRLADEAYAKAGAEARLQRGLNQVHWAQMEALSGDPARLPKARALIADALKVPGIDSGESAVWLYSSQGSLALASEDVPAARGFFEKASAIAETMPDRFTERQRLNLKQRLGFMLIRLGDGVGAERMFRPVHAAFARLEGPDNPDTLNLKLNLIQALMVQKRNAEVVTAATDLLPRMEVRFGEAHRRTLQLLAVRQQSLGALERYAEAAADGERLWRQAAARDGPASFQAVAGRADTATSLCRAGKHAEGIADARAAVAAARTSGPETALSMAVRATLADCLIGAGRMAEAAPMLAGIDRKKVCELVGDAHWDANLDLALAEVALAAGRRDEAARLLATARPWFADASADPWAARKIAALSRKLGISAPRT